MLFCWRSMTTFVSCERSGAGGVRYFLSPLEELVVAALPLILATPPTEFSCITQTIAPATQAIRLACCSSFVVVFVFVFIFQDLIKEMVGRGTTILYHTITN